MAKISSALQIDQSKKFTLDGLLRLLFLHFLHRRRHRLVLGVVRRQGLHFGSFQSLMSETVSANDLVIRKVDSALHVRQALIYGVLGVDRAAAEFAAAEVRDERPSVSTVAGFVLGHYVLESLCDDSPVALEPVIGFEVDLGAPPLPICDHEVGQSRLVIGLALASVGERLGLKHAATVADLALGAHWCPCVEHVHGPLAIPEQENTSIEPQPAALVVYGVIPPVHYHVVILVLLEGELEGHVGEDGVCIHPPEPIDLGVLLHEHVREERLHPPRRHLIVNHVHVVVNLNAMDSGVVHLILDGLQEHLIPLLVLTFLRVRTRDDHDARPRVDPTGRVCGSPDRVCAGLIPSYNRGAELCEGLAIVEKLLHTSVNLSQLRLQLFRGHSLRAKLHMPGTSGGKFPEGRVRGESPKTDYAYRCNEPEAGYNPTREAAASEGFRRDQSRSFLAVILHVDNSPALPAKSPTSLALSK